MARCGNTCTVFVAGYQETARARSTGLWQNETSEKARQTLSFGVLGAPRINREPHKRNREFERYFFVSSVRQT